MNENKIRNVIETFRRMLATDGGVLDLMQSDADVVSVRYVPGHNEQCASCVLTPTDLQLLLEEAIHDQVPEVRSVRVLSE